MTLIFNRHWVDHAPALKESTRKTVAVVCNFCYSRNGDPVPVAYPCDILQNEMFRYPASAACLKSDLPIMSFWISVVPS